MTAPVTPNPGIHQAPRYDQQKQFIAAQQLAIWAEQLPLAMMKQLVTAILNALNAALPGPLVGPVENFEGALLEVTGAVENALSNIPQAAVQGLEELVSLVQQIINTILHVVGVPASGDPLQQLESALQSSLSGLQSAFINAFDGGAQALNGIIFNYDGGAQVTFSPNITQPLSVIVHHLDGGATGLHDLIFNNDGGAFVSDVATAGSGLMSAIDGGATALAQTVQSNLAAGVSTAQQLTSGVETSIHNAVSGIVSGFFNAITGAGAAVGTVTQAQANSAATNQQSAVASSTQNIGGMTGLTVASLNQALQKSQVGTQGGNGGTFVTLNFSSYSAQPTLAGIFNQSSATLSSTGTNNPLGYGSSTSAVRQLGITTGLGPPYTALVEWQSSGTTGYDFEYYPTATTSDYQVVSTQAGGASGPSLLIGRSNTTMGTCVVAYYIEIGINTGNYGLFLGCFVSGAWTLLASTTTTALNAFGLFELVLGNPATSNPYSMSVIFNGTTLLTYADSGHVSQLGSSYRYAGLGGVDYFLNPLYFPPSMFVSWGVADNAPPAQVGSGFRAYRTSTTNTGFNTSISPSTVSAGGATFSLAQLPASGLDTIQWQTADTTWTASSNTLTVSIAAWYDVTVAILIDFTANAATAPGVWHNGTLAQMGQMTTYVSGNIVCIQASFSVYCAANDTLTPGVVYSGSGFFCQGDSNGIGTYFQVALGNCGTLS